MPLGGRQITNRLFDRVAVPSGQRVSAMFWPGGLELPPVENSPETPVWFGDLVDLSVGGFALRAQHEVRTLLSAGDIVGV
jgi:hypothetical protein